MKTKKLTLICSIGLILVLLASILLAACAKEEAPAAPAPAAPAKPAPTKPAPTTPAPTTPAPTTPAPTTPAPTTPAPTTPAPAPAAEVIKWKMQTYMPTASLVYEMNQMLIDRLEDATGGRLKITLYPGGTLTPLYESLEAVGTGALEAAVGYGTAYSGQIPEAGLFKEQPHGIQRYGSMWRLFYGTDGWYYTMSDLMAEHNVKLIALNIFPGNEPIRSTVPINRMADFKGMKIRMGSGVGPFYAKYLGVEVVQMAGGELYTAAQLGTIDAFEYSSGTADWQQGFHEVAPYIIMPPWDGPCEEDIIANMDAWNDLPADIQTILYYISRDYGAQMWTMTVEADQYYTDKMLEYGNVIISLPDKEVKQMREWAVKYRTEQAESISPTMVKMMELYEKIVQEEELGLVPRTK